MCGIAGWVDFDRDLTNERGVAAAMAETMACRGPDDEGLWLARHVALGHRRLAVIDIDGGRQPMSVGDSVDDVATLIYSGEVYNFRELRRDEAARLTAVRIPGDHGTGALVSSLARQLPRHLDDYGAADRARLGAVVLDLLTVALAGCLDRDELDREGGAPPESRGRALPARIQAFVEQRLADPHLSPATVAAAHFISVRYLYRLFGAEGTTVAAWIRDRRLDRCRRDLSDPTLLDRPVGAIAARWGFTNPAHFSRAFRAAYGLPPGEYRVACTGSG